MPVLIERAEHVEGRAVEKEPPVSGLEATKADRAFEGVDRRAARHEFDRETIEIRRVGRPGFGTRNGEFEFERRRAKREFAAGRDLIAARAR